MGELEATSPVGPSRRALLGGAAGVGIALLAPQRARAQARTLQFWTTQRGPTQVKAYEDIWKSFEAANPGYTFAVQYMTKEEYLPELTAALAADAAPDLMSQRTLQPLALSMTSWTRTMRPDHGCHP